jgi:hypothetical protein
MLGKADSLGTHLKYAIVLDWRLEVRLVRGADSQNGANGPAL